MLEEFPIKKIDIENEDFPFFLKEIPDPPKCLYFRGQKTWQEGKRFIGIVGSRKFSDYGKAVVFKIVPELIKAGFITVSGMAPGIDSLVHQATIEAGGKTIAVLGTGLDEKYIWPSKNLKLAKNILKSGGSLISEYLPKTSGSRFSFPKRNRIISGLSLGVVVIEAKIKSGALITASYAKIQKRKIFAVPGSIFFSNSAGANWLIKQGARLVDSAEDVLKEFGIDFQKEKKDFIFKDKKQKIIFEIVSGGPCSVEEIIKKSNFSSSEVLTILTILEAEGLIKNLGGARYSI